MTTPIYGLIEWASSQASPWVPHNTALRGLEAAAQGIVLDRDLSSPPGTCADGACYLIAAGASGLWAGQEGKMAVAVGANAVGGWIFVTVATLGRMLWVADESAPIRYNGTSWVVTSSSYRVGGFITNTPAASEILLVHAAVDDFTLPIGLAGSQIISMPTFGVNPSASFVLTLRKNGTSIGTITISTAGAVTISFTSDVAFAVGDVFSLHGPAVADSAFSNWVLTFKGVM